MERLRRDLHRVLDDMRSDLERIEILTAAMIGFSKPVPDYEDGFRHMPHMRLDAHRMG